MHQRTEATDLPEVPRQTTSQIHKVLPKDHNTPLDGTEVDEALDSADRSPAVVVGATY